MPGLALFPIPGSKIIKEAWGIRGFFFIFISRDSEFPRTDRKRTGTSKRTNKIRVLLLVQRLILYYPQRFMDHDMDHDAITPKKCLVLTICGAFSHRFFQFLPRFSALCPPLRLQRRSQNLPMLINISVCPGGSAQLAIFESSSPPHLLPLKGWYRDYAWAFFVY